MPLDEALDSGAMAIFGEKYSDEVRVVRVPGLSAELCGGTHVHRTGDIGLFKIASESSVAAGVRRLEAVTGDGAVSSIQETDRIIRDLSALLKTGKAGLVERISGLAEEVRELQRKKEKVSSRSAASVAEEILPRVEEIGVFKVAVAEAGGLDMKALRDLTDRLKDRLGDAVLFLAAAAGDRLLMVAGSAGKAKEKVDAGRLVGEIAPLAGGKGGGRADFAQAGGRRVEKLSEVLEAARQVIRKQLSP
jgi:alanyl-tRNA synthetase